VSPLAYHLLRFQFDAYVTLTFGANWNARKSRNKLERIYAWLREIYQFHTGARVLERIPFLIAEELGEVGERFHVHILLAGLGKRPSVSDCFAMEWLWQEAYKGGFAQIRPYDARLGGVRYVLKTLSMADLRQISTEQRQVRAQALAGASTAPGVTTYAGANRYEVGKIGKQYEQGLNVTLSLGLVELLQARANSRRGSDRAARFFRRRSKTKTPPGTREKR
jgi:hypothetical protein